MRALVSVGPRQGRISTVKVELMDLDQFLAPLDCHDLGTWSATFNKLPDKLRRVLIGLYDQGAVISVSTDLGDMIVGMAMGRRAPEFDVQLMIEALIAVGIRATKK